MEGTNNNDETVNKNETVNLEETVNVGEAIILKIIQISKKL